MFLGESRGLIAGRYDLRRASSRRLLIVRALTLIMYRNFIIDAYLNCLYYHLMGSLLPLPHEPHKFVQVYFMGGNETEAQQRCENVHGGLQLDIVMTLQEMLHQHHMYVGRFNCSVLVYVDR